MLLSSNAKAYACRLLLIMLPRVSSPHDFFALFVKGAHIATSYGRDAWALEQLLVFANVTATVATES